MTKDWYKELSSKQIDWLTSLRRESVEENLDLLQQHGVVKLQTQERAKLPQFLQDVGLHVLIKHHVEIRVVLLLPRLADVVPVGAI